MRCTCCPRPDRAAHTRPPGAAGRLGSDLRRRGAPRTRQRRTILGIIETANKHLDAAQILRRAQKTDRGVDRVTVYRTLGLLKRHGLIDELALLPLRGHRHYYESHGPRDHIHVACIRCGKVREFESQLYDDLKKQISRDCGIEISVARTEVGGLCAECRGKS